MPRGAAVIEYDGKRGKTWRVKYVDASGKQCMETVGSERDGFTRKQAEAELRERLVRVERKGYRRPAPLTFRAASKRWETEVGARKQWRPATSCQYRSILERLNTAFGTYALADVRPSHVADYVTAQLRTHAAATVNRDLSVLHSIFTWAVVLELVDRNPTDGANRPAIRQRKGAALTPIEVRTLLKHFRDEQARAAFLTFVLTGVRRAELQALRWADIDFIDNVIRIRDAKTETGVRSIALSPALAEELWQHRRRTAFAGGGERVFCHPERGSLYRYELFTKALRAAYKAAGMVWPEKLRPCHDLRVTALTNDAIAGASPVALMTKAGHASMQTTRRYLNMAGVTFPEEAAALELRLLGGGLSTPGSTRLTAPEPISADPRQADKPERVAPTG